MRLPSAHGSALPLAIVLALAVVGYCHLLGSGDILYSPHSDLVTQHYASFVEQGDGGWPFWRSDQFSGYPHFSNPQSLTTHPLFAIYYFVSPRHGLNVVVWLHLLAAGVIFYSAGVLLGLSRAACLFMAVAALFNFKLIIMVYAGLLPVLLPTVLVPLFVALALVLLRSPTTETAIGFGVCTALGLLAGHFQVLYYAATILFGLVLWELGRGARRRDFGRLASQVRCLGLAVAVCLGLVAFKYLPFLLEMGLLSRVEMSYEEFLFRDAPSARHLLTLFHPEALGTPLDQSYAANELWEDVLYFGLAPLVLALAGLGLPRGSAKELGIRGFALFGILASLLLAFDTPLQKLTFDHLPGFGLLRSPVRFFHLTAFFGILLAGVGVDRLRCLLERRGLFEGRRKVLLFGALLVLMAIEGGTYGRRYLTTVPVEEAFPESPYQQLFEGAEAGHRIAPIIRATQNYGWAAHMGLQLVTGYEPYNLAHYQKYMDLVRYGRITDSRSRVWCDVTRLSRLDLLDALSVRYLVAPAPIDLPGDRLRLAAKLPLQPAFVFYQGLRRADLHVYENPKALPRAYLADRVAAVASEEEMIWQLAAGELGKTAIVLAAAPPAQTSAGGSVRVLRQRDGFLEIAVETEVGGLLVVSEVWHPGWRATIEGREGGVPVYRTNLSLMSLEVPAGKSRVRLGYRPLGWTPGVAISLATLALVALLLFVRRRRLRAASRPSAAVSAAPAARPGGSASARPGS